MDHYLFKRRIANIHFYRNHCWNKLFRKLNDRRGDNRLDDSSTEGYRNRWKDGTVRNRRWIELFARLNGESQLALNLDENLSLPKGGFGRAGKNRLVSAKFGFLVTSSRSDSVGTLEHD